MIGEEGSIYISDEDGYTVGRIRSNGDIWLVYLEESKDDSSAKDSIIKKNKLKNCPVHRLDLRSG